MRTKVIYSKLSYRYLTVVTRATGAVRRDFTDRSVVNQIAYNMFQKNTPTSTTSSTIGTNNISINIPQYIYIYINKNERFTKASMEYEYR